MLSASLGQFGRDCRNLMRSEIGEVMEAFSANQVGSSTMAHKRNPINFENLEGMWLRNKNEMGKIMDTMISEHQRDLVGSCVYRDFPIILINLQQQLDTLLREDENKKSFLARMQVDAQKCYDNFEESSNFILAEPLYITLQMAGYQKDAHHLVNHVLVPYAKKQGVDLFQALIENSDYELKGVISCIPEEIKDLLHNSKNYIGTAEQKALDIAYSITDYLCDIPKSRKK
jgi:adenylosuccinate lyase